MGALDRLRTTFRWKADDLDAAGLQVRVGASSLTLGGLLKHLAFVEDYMFTTKLTGAPWDFGAWDGENVAVHLRRRRHPSMQLYALLGRAPSNGPARGSTRPWQTADSSPEPRVPA